MIRSLPNSRTYTWGYHLFVICYFIFLFAPLFVTCVLAFNDSQFPALPWKGFTLDWFLADAPRRLGLFNDSIYANIAISAPSLSMKDAWEAAEIACIADDIREMPMGMHTVISEGQGGISIFR